MAIGGIVPAEVRLCSVRARTGRLYAPPRSLRDRPAANCLVTCQRIKLPRRCRFRIPKSGHRVWIQALGYSLKVERSLILDVSQHIVTVSCHPALQSFHSFFVTS